MWTDNSEPRLPKPLLLLIGLPGSGKSTLASALLQQYPQARLISTDGIRADLYGDEAIQGSWLRIWLEVRQRFLQAIDDPGCPFAIYDATNAVRTSRRQAIDLARKSGFGPVIGIWLNVPLDLCLQRNQARSRQVPEPIIQRMARRLYGAPPSLDEGLDACFILENPDDFAFVLVLLRSQIELGQTRRPPTRRGQPEG